MKITTVFALLALILLHTNSPVYGELFFEANDDVHGSELWKTDGTEAGTVMVKDIRPGSGTSTINQLTVMNGELFFEAYDVVHGNELWKTDGTEAGTVMVKDIRPGSGSSTINQLITTFVPIVGDFDSDGDVDMADFVEFSGHWLEGVD